MPVPKTKSVGTLKKFFRKEHPEWSEDKVTAASLNQARKHGASIPKPNAKRKSNASKVKGKYR